MKNSKYERLVKYCVKTENLIDSIKFGLGIDLETIETKHFVSASMKFGFCSACFRNLDCYFHKFVKKHASRVGS